MDAIEKKLREDIQQNGWHVLNVSPDRGHPPHSYSIGLFATFEHPEIVIFGLPGATAQKLIDVLADDVKEGESFEPGCRYSHVLKGYDVMFVRVAPETYQKHFGRALDYYGSVSFPVVQMVWPDRNGLYPWESGCDPEIRKLQPVLSRPNRNNR